VDRDRVAEAALSLIAMGGIRSVTPSALARQLRIPPERLARAYPNGAAIAAALLEYAEVRLEEHVRSASTGVDDAIARLERLITLSCDAMRGDSRLLSIALSIALSLGARGRQYQQRVLSILMSYLKDVTDIVRDGQRLGRIRADVDAGTVALMYLGLIQPAVILSHVSDGSFDLRNHVQRSFKLFRETIEA
jgi:AcrR family transcriptional regulator